MRILIVEDEYKLAELVSVRLKKENYQVSIATDGESGLYEALTDSYDLLLLDIMLPKLSGVEILKRVRTENINSKIIMLTAKSALEDKLLGLTSGANDYISQSRFILTNLWRGLIFSLGARSRKQNRASFNSVISSLIQKIRFCQMLIIMKMSA